MVPPKKRPSRCRPAEWEWPRFPPRCLGHGFVQGREAVDRSVPCQRRRWASVCFMQFRKINENQSICGDGRPGSALRLASPRDGERTSVGFPPSAVGPPSGRTAWRRGEPFARCREPLRKKSVIITGSPGRRIRRERSPRARARFVWRELPIFRSLLLTPSELAVSLPRCSTRISAASVHCLSRETRDFSIPTLPSKGDRDAGAFVPQCGS
jgi:hypothetical protein